MTGELAPAAAAGLAGMPAPIRALSAIGAGLCRFVGSAVAVNPG
jgi:hypothetical protein